MKTLRHKFVDSAPEDLEEGVLYISMNYGTVLHKCCCGCGNEVSTPLSPASWKLKYDGENISLSPSIGNWSFPCKSHYWIKKSEVVWARKWTDEEIKLGREDDAEAQRIHYEKDKWKKKWKNIGKWKSIIGMFRTEIMSEIRKKVT